MLKNWIEVELGDVLLLSSEKHKPEIVENLFYIGLEHIEKDTGRLTIDTAESTINTIKNKFYTNQILYGKLRPYLNKVYLATQSGVCSTDILVFNVSESTYSKYAFHFMLSRQFVNDMSANTSGVNLPRVSTKYINSYKFPLAPLPEQRAIAAKIEQLFSELDNGIANLKTAKSKLEIYRQAILKQAFEGNLTKNWRKKQPKNHGNHINQKNHSTDNLPETWKWINLGEIIEKPKYGTSKKCTYNTDGVGVLRIPNINDGKINDSDLKYASFTSEEITTYALKEGDLLTIRSNGSVDLVGKCALISKLDEKHLYAGYLIRLRPKKNIIQSKYLLYCLISHALRIQIESKAKSTSGVNNINSGELESLLLPLPLNFTEQTQIVQEIETRLSVCDKLNEAIDQSLEKAQALRQSILKKAFEGKLLSEDELQNCRQQPDWEPAAKLLERVKKDSKIKK